MHLTASHLLGASSSTNANISIPEWVLWGVGTAALLTLVALACASLFALAITGITGGWQGGARPWRAVGGTIKMFIIGGLPIGLMSSYFWSHENWWAGLAAGVATLIALWAISLVIEKCKR